MQCVAADDTYVYGGTSIHGGRDHWKVQGAHSIYEPSPKGFRLFVVFPTEITAAFAEADAFAEAIDGLSAPAWEDAVDRLGPRLDGCEPSLAANSSAIAPSELMAVAA